MFWLCGSGCRSSTCLDPKNQQPSATRKTKKIARVFEKKQSKNKSREGLVVVYSDHLSEGGINFHGKDCKISGTSRLCCSGVYMCAGRRWDNYLGRFYSSDTNTWKPKKGINEKLDINVCTSIFVICWDPFRCLVLVKLCFCPKDV